MTATGNITIQQNTAEMININDNINKLRESYYSTLVDRIHRNNGGAWLKYIELPVAVETVPEDSVLNLTEEWKLPIVFSILEKSLEQNMSPPDSSERKSIPSIAEALHQYPRLVLLGDPGAGKTTSVEHMILEALEDISAQNGLIPILLYLSEWRGTAKPNEWLNNELHKLFGSATAVSFDQIALYLDGLNEMGATGEQRSRQLARWLQSRDCPSSVIVTCRTADYKVGFSGKLDLQLPIVMIERMDRTHIEQFAEKYLQDQAGNFLNSLGLNDTEDQDERHLLYLASNPFLLTCLMVVFSHSPSGRLPTNTGVLFDKVIKFAYEKELERKDDRLFSFDQMAEAYSNLAFDLIDNDLPLTFSKDYAVEILGDPQLLADGYGANIIDVYDENVRFYHQLILEYFAALALMRKGINNRLRPPSSYYGGQTTSKWAQTIITLSGLTPDTDALLKTVMNIDLLLAVKCVASGAPVSVELRLQIFNSALTGPGGFSVYDAIDALEQFRHPDTIPFLIKLMSSTDWRPGTGRKAASALEMIGKPAIPALVEALQNEDSRIRGRSADILGRIGGQAVVPLLTNLLSDDSPDDVVSPHFLSGTAANALLNIGTADAIQAVEKWRNHILTQPTELLDEYAVFKLRQTNWKPSDPETAIRVAMATRRGSMEINYWPECIEFGHAIVPHLVALLTADKSTIRRAAAGTLDQLGWEPVSDEEKISFYTAYPDWQRCISLSTSAVPRLEALLTDQDPDIRWAAADTLTRLSWVAPNRELEGAFYLARLDSVRYLQLGVINFQDVMRLFNEYAPERRHVYQVGADILRSSGNSAVPHLTASIKNAIPAIRMNTVVLLSGIGTNSAFQLVVDAQRDEEEGVRRLVAERLGSFASQESVDALLFLVQDISDEVRLAAALSLSRIGWRPTTREEEIAFLFAGQQWEDLVVFGEHTLPVLVPHLGSWKLKDEIKPLLVQVGRTAVSQLLTYFPSTDDNITDALAEVLGQIGSPSAVPALVNCSRAAAIKALAQIDHPQAHEALKTALTTNTFGSYWYLDIQSAAIRSLGEWADKEIVPNLLDLLNNGTYKGDYLFDRRVEVIEILDKLGAHSAIPTLIRLLTDENEKVQSASVSALQNLGWEPKDLESEIALAFATKNTEKLTQIGAPAVEKILEILYGWRLFSISESVLELLGELRNPAACPLLLEIVHYGQKWDAVESALKALANIRSNQAIPSLTELLRSMSFARNLVAETLGEIGDARAIDVLEETLLFDEDKTTREAAAKSLNRLGWVPTDDETNAAFNVVFRNWEECIRIGESTIPYFMQLLESSSYAEDIVTVVLPPLIALQEYALPSLVKILYEDDRFWVRRNAIKVLESLQALEPAMVVPILHDSDKEVRQIAAMILQQKGWDPTKIEEKAAFYIALQNWNACQDMQGDAVPILIAYLQGYSSEDETIINTISQIGEPAIPSLKEALYSADPNLIRSPDATFGRSLVSSLETALQRINTDLALSTLRQWRRYKLSQIAEVN